MRSHSSASLRRSACDAFCRFLTSPSIAWLFWSLARLAFFTPVETPFGKADDVLGGSATFFSAAASHLTDVQVVGVIGNDYPLAALRQLEQRNVDLSGVEQADGPSFGWRGRYRHRI